MYKLRSRVGKCLSSNFIRSGKSFFFWFSFCGASEVIIWFHHPQLAPRAPIRIRLDDNIYGLPPPHLVGFDGKEDLGADSARDSHLPDLGPSVARGLVQEVKDTLPRQKLRFKLKLKLKPLTYPLRSYTGRAGTVWAVIFHTVKPTLLL